MNPAKHATWIGIAVLACVVAGARPAPAAEIPDKPPAEDMTVRDFDEITLKDNPATVWKGEFRRDEEGRYEVLPNGRMIFDVKEGKSRDIVLKVLPREIQEVRLKQGEEEVLHKRYAKLPTGRLDVPKYVKEAASCQAKGYLELAESLLRRALAIDEQSLEVYGALGDLLRSRFDVSAELELYQKALGAKIPRPEGIHARLGGLLGLLGLQARAEDQYRKALALDARHVESLVGLGRLYMGLRRFQDAADRFDLAAKNVFDKAQKADVLRGLGEAQLKLGLVEEAKRTFEDAALNAPDDRGIKACIGAVYYLRGELALARQKFMEILDLSESDIGGTGEEEAAEEDAGEEEDGGGEADTGEEEKADPWGPSTEFDPFRARAMGNLALCLLREGSLTQAEHYLRLAAGLDPTSPFPWIVLGYLREKQQRFGDGKAAYEKALTISPGEPQAHYALGVLYLRAGETGSARSSFLAAVESDPDFTDALVKLGRIAVEENRGREGVLYFERALALNPGVADWHAALGSAWAAAGDPARAGEAFRKTLALDPAHPIAKAGVLFSLYYAPGGEEEAYLKMKRTLEEPEGLPPEIVAYLKALKDSIETNRGKVQWLDDFERAPSTQVARKWEQREGRGPVIRLNRGRVLMEGSQLKAGETVLERELEAEKFVRFEADVFVTDLANHDAGVTVALYQKVGNRQGNIQGGVRLGKNRKGKLVVWEYDIGVSRWREKGEYGSWPVTESGGNRLEVEYYLDTSVEGREDYKLRFWVNGNPVGEPFVSDRFRRGFKSGEIWVGAFAAAEEGGTSVKVEADNVRLVTLK